MTIFLKRPNFIIGVFQKKNGIFYKIHYSQRSFVTAINTFISVSLLPCTVDIGRMFSFDQIFLFLYKQRFKNNDLYIFI